MSAGTVGPPVVDAPRASRRHGGPSLGPVPLGSIVVVEVGLAVAVALVALDRTLLPVAGIVLSVALVLGLVRRRGRWLVQWLGLGLRFRMRARSLAEAVGPEADPRLDRLRLATGDLTLVEGRDHDGRAVALVGHEGAWSTVLGIDDSDAPLVTEAGGATVLPLGAVAGALSDRGVVLDAATALWHCRPDGADLAADAPALAAYREVLGPLPAVARRTVWLVLRLDPSRCPDAVAERGGGVLGAQRAVLGATARVRRVLADHGVAVRPLDTDGVLRAGVTAAGAEHPAGLPPEAHDAAEAVLHERWDAVVLGDVGHATWAVSGWPAGSLPELTSLTTARALSSTLALTVEPVPDEGDDEGGDDGPGRVAVRACVRLAGRTPEELATAGAELAEAGARLGLRLDPLDGQQAAALATTLPLGTAS